MEPIHKERTVEIRTVFRDRNHSVIEKWKVIESTIIGQTSISSFDVRGSIRKAVHSTNFSAVMPMGLAETPHYLFNRWVFLIPRNLLFLSYDVISGRNRNRSYRLFKELSEIQIPEDSEASLVSFEKLL